MFNTAVISPLAARGKVVVEGSVLASRWSLEGDNVVVGVPRELKDGVRLPRGVGVVFLPVGRREWAVLPFGSGDDFKSLLGPGGSGTFLNAQAQSATLADKSLWDAPIWHVGPLPAAIAHAFSLIARPGRLAARQGLWSTQEIVAGVNHRRLQAGRQEAARLWRLETIAHRLNAHEWLSAADAAEDVRTRQEAAFASEKLTRAAMSVELPHSRAGASAVSQGRGPAETRLTARC
ncbi:MAG: hypothetical protein QM783_10630 [Phycisphaerales bacterium]